MATPSYNFSAKVEELVGNRFTPLPEGREIPPIFDVHQCDEKATKIPFHSILHSTKPSVLMIGSFS